MDFKLIFPKLIQKETFIVVFDSQITADYWRYQFTKKYFNEVTFTDRHQGKVELKDQIWFFLRGEARIFKELKGTFLFPESIYIILDDPERKRLETYEGV